MVSSIGKRVFKTANPLNARSTHIDWPNTKSANAESIRMKTIRPLATKNGASSPFKDGEK